MKDKEQVIIDLLHERHTLMSKINKLNELKYKRTNEFLELGSIMCQMLDTQLEIMNSYFEILTLRIMYLKEQINDKD